jgi:site-specific DNA recombinase
VRISSDPTGAGLGVARQEEDCRALSDRIGWRVTRVYRDNDVSVYTGRPHPQWRQLLADIHTGLVDAIVCWHVDRLTSCPRELEEVIDLHDKRGINLATVTREIDLSTPTGRMLPRMLGAAARHETEHKAERHRRAGLRSVVTARATRPTCHLMHLRDRQREGRDARGCANQREPECAHAAGPARDGDHDRQRFGRHASGPAPV